MRVLVETRVDKLGKERRPAKEEEEEEDAIEKKRSRRIKKNGGSRYHEEKDSFHISNKHCDMGFIPSVCGVGVIE